MLTALLAILLAAAVAGPRPLPAAEEPVRPEGETSLAGRLVVAQPEVEDPRFHEAVVLLVRHDESGAFGLIVNKPLAEVDLAEALADMGRRADDVSGRLRVHFGGPVDPQRGFILHTTDSDEPPLIEVPGGYGLSMSTELLRAIADGQGPSRSLFLVGYAGWSPGQLEAELARKDWVVAPADEKLVFDEAMEKKWLQAFARRFQEL